MLSSLAVGAIELIDDQQQKVSLSSPARRIISLTPHITQSLKAIGAEAQIIGTIAADGNRPKHAQIIGNEHGLNQEAIFLLKPDLIIAWGSGSSQAIARLKHMGIPVFVTDPRHLGDIPKALEDFGRLTGHRSEAKMLADQLRTQEKALVARYDKKKTVSVFVQVWLTPIITLGNQSILDEAIERCGGRNIFHDQSRASLTVGVESILVHQPELIIGLLPENERQAFFGKWQGQKQLNSQIRWLDLPALSEPGPGFMAATEKLCQVIEQVRPLK